jgi:hypothetical protein
MIHAADYDLQSDQHQLAPIANAIEANLGRKPAQLAANAGYCSDANLAAMEEREIDAYIAPGRTLGSWGLGGISCRRRCISRTMPAMCWPSG